MENITTEELRTIVWMCQNQAAQIARRDSTHGKRVEENATYQRIISISKKAYSELIRRDNM